MTYNGGDIGSLRFLAANVIYQATGKLLQGDDASDRGVLDDMVLMLDLVSSYHSEDDPKFATEWKAIQQERARALAQVKDGFELDPSVTEGLRWREGKAMFRALCRKGTFVRQDSPATEWIPQVNNGATQ